MRSTAITCSVTIILLVVGCRGRQESQSQLAGICVTNTYLQSAVNDLTGNAKEVFTLVGPGMCPGHFDMSPEQLRQLLGSAILYRFDYQAGLDEKLNRMDCPIVPVSGRPGMCIPQTYLETCREILPPLAERFPEEQAAFQQRLDRLEDAFAELEQEIKRRVAAEGLQGANVIASYHQAEFVRWLGLNVVATFRGTDSMTPPEIQQCLNAGRDKGVRLIIANQQEGTDLPRRFADQLDGRYVVFSNFPDTQTAPEHAFAHLLRTNIERLLQ